MQAARCITKRLQIVQNKALRWIYNIRWDDFVTNASLHERAGLLPLNQSWRLAVCKQLEKLVLFNTSWPDHINRVLLAGQRAGIGRDLFSVDWSEEVEQIL